MDRKHDTAGSEAATDGFPPLPGETAADYLERHKSEHVSPGRTPCVQACSIMPTLADALALQAQDPEHVEIQFGEFEGPYILCALGKARFIFPEALRDVAEDQEAA